MLLKPSAIVHQVIGAAIDVHRAIGPGLLESAYTRCLEYEFVGRAVRFRRNIPVPLHYKDIVVDAAYRADLLVDETLLIEVKSVDALLPIHQAQIMTYLKLLNLRQGLLINFNVPRLVDGIRNVLL